MGEIVFTSDPCGPTTKAGVYLVTLINPETKKRKVFYVGSSKNIQKRVLNPSHPYRKLFDRFSERFWVVTEDYETDNYIELEKELIRYFKPVMNNVHNSKNN